MRVTTKMLEERIKNVNDEYGTKLSVHYFNGLTWLYLDGTRLEVGTKGECYKAVAHFAVGVLVGREK